MATILNKGTQKAQGFIESYRMASASALSDVYGSWSDNKQKAYDDCLKTFRKMDGDRFRIISHSQNFFTVGFIFERDDEEWLRIETYANSFEIRMEEE